ncbi:B12-binding domain-containing radical SAM protein [Desulfosarcina widdelii]|uniref:B12-binding domain-containing radical SAM protein n=1 Tax=Desulfosarcina widdelii TaxID=947919 RepID=A0A5K7YY52_9BACT|nr:radical SAM protein [Desulfosarcina widdelii]BBO73280.1 B12-binding domain-containing radical SAM protein [Desulfosarcina widdelii]
MKIVLVALYDEGSYGIRILHRLLDNNGYDVVSIFFNTDMLSSHYYSTNEVEKLIESILEQSPDLIGIAVRSPLFQLFKKISKKLKQKTNTPLLVGGHHATVSPEECINYADMVCIGEGEYPLLEICERISRNKPIDNIKNLWIRKDGKVIKNAIGPLIKNLDDIPFPDYTEKNKIYLRNGKIEKSFLRAAFKGSISVMSSRGCFFSCSFCYNATLRKLYKGSGKYYRRRSVDNFIAEILELKNQFKDLSYIYFSDNVFTYDKKWVKDFCNKYKEKINLPFGCFSHFNMIDEAMLIELKDAGLIDVTLGIQSGSTYISEQIYNRKIDKKVIVEGSKILSKLNIKVYYDLITNNPYETDETHMETLELLLSLKRPFHLRTFKMKFYPNVPFTNKLLHDQIIKTGDIESKHEKSFEKWMELIDLSSDKNPNELFWDCLYYLVQKNFPKKLIMYISKSHLIKRRPKILGIALKCTIEKPLILLNAIRTIWNHMCSGNIHMIWKAFVYKKKKGWGY